MLLQPYITEKIAFETYKYIFTWLILCTVKTYNISHFQLLLFNIVRSNLFSWHANIVSWSRRGWIAVRFIDWWSYNFEVACQLFDQLHEAFEMK